MGAVDWTEKCRDEVPESAGWLDYPLDDGDTLNEVVSRSEPSDDDEEEDDSDA
jgi:hypothetical protein